MENFYLVIVLIIMALAILDLVVGVSNDAANFLNSALGSKAAPRYVILTVASIGILIGAITSSGIMMEIARSGVFNPAMFTFKDIMMVFLAVILTDVILLDLFNTIGLPTSTTVSLIFELLGAAVAISLITIGRSEVFSFTDLSQFINTSKAMAIISGILLSVAIAFICGSIVMFITRIIFTFHFKKTFAIFGSVWCGIAFTAISYFAVFKGLKGSSIMTPEILYFLDHNLLQLIIVMFLGWTAVSALLQYVFKLNTFKATVLAGTFSLALAFAGNDLVNFIGVFMASYDSYEIVRATGDYSMTMEALSRPVAANTFILAATETIMTLTLWFSKKARKVSDTEVNLAKQDSGMERFGSTPVSRAIVRLSLGINRNYERYIPGSVKKYIAKRFRNPEIQRNSNRAPFDLIRATVNLTVASLLISTATTLKLPLFTTYVTFMVAMGTSLADKAWGRESAVYRITGVLTVISGWFLTALVAFTVAAIVACVLMWGGKIGIIVMVALCGLMILQSALIFKRKARKVQDEEDKKQQLHSGQKSIIEICEEDIRATMKKIIDIYHQTLIGLFNEDRKLLKKWQPNQKNYTKKLTNVNTMYLPH